MIKVYALPCAGGSSTLYYQMKKYNNDEIKIIPIELSGRGHRFNEPLYSNFEEAVNDVYSIICADINNNDDYAIFGYSMGSLLAYEVCCLMKKNSIKLPCYLFLASMSAPNTESVYKKFGNSVEDTELLNFVIDIDGIPASIASNSAFYKVFFPIIKSDFNILFNYKTASNYDLEIDMTVLYGNADEEVAKNIYDWEKYTSKMLKIYEFEGGHFFINQNAKEIFQIIRENLLY